MIRPYTSLAGMLLGAAAFAQSFSLSPNDTLWVNAPLSGLSIHDIYQVNETGYPLELRWDSVLVDMPAAWDYSMCDLGHCYPGLPAQGGVMIPVEVGESAFMGLNLIPNGVAGTGILQASVTDLNVPGSTVLLTWIITAGVVGVDEATATSAIQLYPVPAQDRLEVRVGSAGVLVVRVHDLTGRAVNVPVLRTGTGLVLEVSALQPGGYVLAVGTGEGAVRKSFIKQ